MRLFRHVSVNDYFDQVFVINLRQNLQKWNITANMLARYGFTWECFKGVNGFEEKQVQAWRDYANRGLVHPFEHILQRKLIESPGAWGTLLSCKNLIETARDEGLERILVLEDDVMIHRDFLTLFPKVAAELPSDWKLIYFGCRPDDWSDIKPFSEHLYRPGVISHDDYRPITHGAFAYALHASTFDLALQHIEAMEWPFDSGSLKEINRQFPEQTFAVQPHLFIPDISVSSIREPGDNVEWAQAARAQQSHYESRQLQSELKTKNNKTSTHLKVVALLVVRDKTCRLEKCLQYLHAQGVEICLIDLGYTGHRIEMAQYFIDHGVFRIEYVPLDGSNEREKLLFCKQKLALEISADWFVYQDTDEIPEAPRPYINLLEGIQDADYQGYNTINFDEFIFVPKNNKASSEEKSYFQDMLHYYFFEPEQRCLLRAWKKTVYPIGLCKRGEHSAVFPNQKVFPIFFRLRHYIFNSCHGIEKYGQFSSQYRLKKLRDPYDWNWDKSEPWRDHAFSVNREVVTE